MYQRAVRNEKFNTIKKNPNVPERLKKLQEFIDEEEVLLAENPGLKSTLLVKAFQLLSPPRRRLAPMQLFSQEGEEGEIKRLNQLNLNELNGMSLANM